jgi:hypothetical protein
MHKLKTADHSAGALINCYKSEINGIKQLWTSLYCKQLTAQQNIYVKNIQVR